MINSLAKDLEIKPGQSISVINAPSYYFKVLGDLPENIIVDDEPVGKFDFVQLFAKNLDELTRLAPNAIGSLKPNATFWVSYPRESSQVQTDLTSDVGWDVIYDHKFKPVDHIEIDDMWAARRFKRPE